MKKCFFFVLTASVLLACNPENKPGGEGEDKPGESTKATVVRVGTQTLNFEAISPESQTLKVYADGSWTSEAPDWVTLNPTSGDGTVTVTVSVTDNESTEGRVGTVVFAPELASTTNVLTIQQKGDNKVHLKTGQALADWLAKLTNESLDEAYISADLDMTGITLVPAAGFAGLLDGGGHSIKNLFSTKPIFKVNKGTLQNIVIDASCSFEPDTLLFGALAARNEGVVKDCINKGTVTRTIEATDSKCNVIAGLIGLSTPKADDNITVSGCKNFGKVSIVVGLDKDNGEFTTQGVAGVVGYSLTPLEGCENYGEISLSGGWHGRRACPIRDPADPDTINAGEFYDFKVGSSVGGVVAWAIGPLNQCRNAGPVSWTESRVENMNTSPAHIFTGGVAGTYFGAVTDCSNTGNIIVKAVTSDGRDFAGQNHQHCIGGVLGAVDNPSADGTPSKNRGVTVSGCTNSGTITMEANTSKSWTHLGGVIGWPASDNDSTNPNNWGVMSSCTNSGAITVSGTAQFRCGGLVGATPYMVDCANTGNITINGAKSSSEIGGVAGRHWGYAQTLRNCSSKADVNALVPLEGISGYIGWIGNNKSATIEGGSVSGKLTAAAGSTVGMLLGGFGGDKVTVVLGSPTAPIEVSGSVNGTAITADNAATLLWGSNYNATVHSVNYVIK